MIAGEKQKMGARNTWALRGDFEDSEIQDGRWSSEENGTIADRNVNKGKKLLGGGGDYEHAVSEANARTELIKRKD